MARKETVTYTYTDDLTGEEFSEDEITTVEFGYNGKNYLIDLGPENATKLDEFLVPYIKKAMRYNAKSSSRSTPDKRERPGILQWAKAEKLVKESHRGRLPNSVIEAYDAAH